LLADRSSIMRSFHVAICSLPALLSWGRSSALALLPLDTHHVGLGFQQRSVGNASGRVVGARLGVTVTPSSG